MDYYKVTNEQERHRGLQYHTGLVVDPQPFHPAGDCEPGGIYFAREDILAFGAYGPWLRRVTVPPGAQVYANPGAPRNGHNAVVALLTTHCQALVGPCGI